MSGAVPPWRLETGCRPNPSTLEAARHPRHAALAIWLWCGLLDHVGEQPQEARAFDRAGQLALLGGRHRGDAARHDLAALGHVAAEQAGILVVDLRRVVAGERAGLATPVERAPRGGGGSLGHGSAPVY